jgi:hypothetical protein
MFTDRQVHFMCNRASFCEDMDERNDPASYLEVAEPREFWLRMQDSDKPYTMSERHRMADEDYRQMVDNYTQRMMTNDRDSLNAFLGIQNYLTTSWKLKDFHHGLPLKDFPQALIWYHDRSVKTSRRRIDFPSWSWTGWEGAVVYDRALYAESGDDSGIISTDMTIKLVDSAPGTNIIELEGFLVDLKVVTEPFSEAYTADGQVLLGVLRERNFLHNNTIQSGRYRFLVVERVHTKGFGNTVRQSVDMLLLDQKEGMAVRNTFARLSLEKGVDFEIANPVHDKIKIL